MSCPINQVERARDAVSARRSPTPALVIDLARVQTNASILRRAFPGWALRYAVDQNPEPAVIRTLAVERVQFGAASAAHVDMLVRHGVSADQVALSAVVASASDVRAVSKQGVRRFAAAGLDHLALVLECRPGALMSFRIGRSAEASASELNENDIGQLLKEIDRRQLPVSIGLDLVLGRHPETFEADIELASRVMENSPLRIHELTISGRSDCAETIAAVLGPVLDSAVLALPYRPERLAVEMGPALVADAGVMITEVVGQTERDGNRVVHVDCVARSLRGVGSSELLAFDRPIGVLDEATVCTGDGVIAAELQNLPVDLETGERLALVAAGAAWEPRVHTVVCEPRLDDPAFDFDVVLPGDSLFPLVSKLEFETFQAAGLLASDGTLLERRFGDLSRMIVVKDQDDICGVMRVADASSFGFEAFHWLSLDEAGIDRIHGLDLNSCVEVLTSAPLNRDPVTALRLYHSVMLDGLARGKTHLVASMVEEVWMGVNRHLGEGGVGPFIPVGPTDEAHHSTPVILDMWASERALEVLGGKIKKYQRAQRRRTALSR